ncbi:MAG: tyrosine-protein phosphatase [Gemmatimonadaceae bacterium]|nr:tyrosine-protein phosphatase [Gemmatimonadaceae bacterium]
MTTSPRPPANSVRNAHSLPPVLTAPRTMRSTFRTLATTIAASAFLAGCTHRAITPAPAAPAAGLAAGQALGIASVPNLRDVGGYATTSGAVVRRGLLYRSNQLNPISPDDRDKLAQLRLKNDFDLRTSEEVRLRPDQLPLGVVYHQVNVLADADMTAILQLSALLREPRKANDVLRNGTLKATYTQLYRDVVSLPSARQSYRELFVSISHADQLPALFHCTAGKDRAGWGAAAFLTLLGVPRETVMADYLRSNDNMLRASRPQIDAFVEAGGDRSLANSIFGVEPEYLEAAFDEVQKRYGTIEHYFAEGLGIDAAGQKKLRDVFLEKRTKGARPS